MASIVLPTGRGQAKAESMAEFAETLKRIQSAIDFKVSARGWAYLLEQDGAITKAQFDQAENAVNTCRASGLLPIDFTAEEEARKFSGVEEPDEGTPVQYMGKYLTAALKAEEFFTPDWWDGEKHYIQMIVEKVDLKSLFGPVCEDYKIPIATAKGWSSMLQRAEYARRFQEAEDRGLKPVLLYCGDHDPDGLRISEFLRSNLRDLIEIVWEDGTGGYDPENLIIERFGLNYEFITRNSLSWINNLITGSGRDLASPNHKNFHMPYVQEYLRTIGARKCEANALVTRAEQGRELCRQAIEKYLGSDALQRFRARRQTVRNELRRFRRRTGLEQAINSAIETIDNDDGSDAE